VIGGTTVLDLAGESRIGDEKWKKSLREMPNPLKNLKNAKSWAR
jgi:hypothetical protein